VRVTHEKAPRPAPDKECNAVTQRKPGSGARLWATPTFEVIPADGNGHIEVEVEVEI